MASKILPARASKLSDMALPRLPALSRPSVAVNVALALLVVGGAVWSYQAIRGEPTADASANAGVRTVAVSQGALTASVTASGSVQSTATASAAFATSGTVTEIAVSVGQHVKKGQLLARIDPAAAKRALALAEANLDAANDALERVRTAGSDTTTAQNEVTSARLAVDGAQADVDATDLTAPMAGTVVAINGTLGSSSGGSSGGGSSAGSSAGASRVSSGPAAAGASTTGGGSTAGSSGFVDLADLTKLQVTAAFPEADATKLKIGQTATIIWNALQNARATGRVVAVDPQATTTNNVVTYGVTADIGQVPTGAKVGQTVTVSVVTGTAEDAVFVNVAAVTGTGNRHLVTVQTATGQREIRPVEVGLKGDQGYQILSGLSPGERVVLPQTSTGGAATTGFGRGGFPGGGAFPGGGVPGGGGLNGGGLNGGGNRGGANGGGTGGR